MNDKVQHDSFLVGFLFGMLGVLAICILFRNANTYHYSGDAEWYAFTLNTYMEERNFRAYSVQLDNSSIKCYVVSTAQSRLQHCNFDAPIINPEAPAY